MEQSDALGEQILEVLRQTCRCELDDLERQCRGLTWNQIFLEVDRLNRTGQLRLLDQGGGIYVLEFTGRPGDGPTLLPVAESSDQTDRPTFRSSS